MTSVQKRYENLIDSMPIHVKVARASQLFEWSRDWVGRQIVDERGPMSPDRLKLEIALRMYGHEDTVRKLIEKAMLSVSN